MKLYFAPRTRAIRPRWLLEELGVPYELVRIDLPTVGTKEFRALSPLREVPVLVDGEVTLFDAAAINLYLADQFPDSHLAPAVGSAGRGEYLQWLLFAEARLEPEVLPYIVVTERASGTARLEELLAVVEQRITGRDFLVGEAFSAADLSMASILHLANRLKLLEAHPALVEYVHRHTARPASIRAVMG